MLQDSKETLGRRLTILRKRRGLTQEEMGACGINPRYYARVERGEVNVSFEKLVTIARALDVSLQELFCLPLAQTPLEAHLTHLLAELTPLIRRNDAAALDAVTTIIACIAALTRHRNSDGSTPAETTSLKAAQTQKAYGRRRQKHKG